MADEIKIKVPDIGGTTGVDVIEVLVKPGDEINKDTPLITLESDKASMEIPSPHAGKVLSLAVKLGDKLSEGDLILSLATEESTSSVTSEPEPVRAAISPVVAPEQNSKPQTVSNEIVEVVVPDIGGATDVDVIEILVTPGQAISKNDSLITLEGDKATMDIPAPFAGIIEKILVKVGDKVSQGKQIVLMKTEQTTSMVSSSTEASISSGIQEEQTIVAPVQQAAPALPSMTVSETGSSLVFAGPAVRRLAREFGVNLADVKGSGRKSRLTKEDVQLYVKNKLREQPSTGGFSLPVAAAIDFSKFGAIETKPLNKIKRLTGVNVHRSWITIPHVTQFDEADITELEAFRKSETERVKQDGYKLTILAFVVKVVAKALAAYPQFNASLDVSGENLIYKKYCNVGIAVETPNGLVVPVIKQIDQLAVSDIALEMTRLSAKARDKSLMPADMSGGCFTISSLGGIGGTAFTPIVNSPEVAILGLSRSCIKPVYDGEQFIPRLMLPLSLSYDHRVIDGAEAARFTRFIADSLSDIRRILL